MTKSKLITRIALDIVKAFVRKRFKSSPDVEKKDISTDLRDEMRIESKFATSVVSKIVERAVRKKFGYNIDVDLNSFRNVVFEDKTNLHLDVDLEIGKEELDKLLESIGL